jgi:PPOX class probable F420-dependent enzyme
MGAHLLPDPGTDLGQRVRTRPREEQVIWFTTAGGDGTPQPNPVWFLWEDTSALVYNRPDAHRLTHIRSRPQVCLHLDGNGRGGDILVMTGRAQVLQAHPLPHQMPGYLDKYRQSMVAVSGSPEAFSSAYPVPVRVEVARVRGF